MSKKKSSKRSELDYYSLKAQKEGYPARSVYKLEELNEKFSLINKKAKILDIGASPGSWSIFCLRKLSDEGYLAAVDLKEISIKKQDDRFFFLKGDFFDETIQKQLVSKGPYNLIISDAAPSTTGNRTVDAGRSFSLASGIISIAGKMLQKGGNLVIKIFQGGDEKELSLMIENVFEKNKIFKPKACRKESFETYLVGLNYKG